MSYLLSICIPTYNREQLLDKTLRCLANEIGDDPRVEVVVSDNASTDNTREMFETYACYSNFKYFVNDSNLGPDKNIEKVLTLASGVYLKFLNDYIEFEDGCLQDMLLTIQDNLVDKPILFFPDANAYSKTNDRISTNSLDEFLQLNPIHATWLAAIGFWKDDFEILREANKDMPGLFFYQTQILFKNFTLKNKAITINKKYYRNNPTTNKGGYNFFLIFVNNYLNIIIKGLKKEKLIKTETYKIIIKRFFWDFIRPWYIVLKIKKFPGYQYDMKGSFLLIFNKYKYEPIFYYGMLNLFAVFIKFKINNIANKSES